MKTKPAPKTAAEPPPSPIATLQANIRANLPDADTAAALAATLAAGRPIDKASAADFAGQAIDLWQAAKLAVGERFAATLVAHDKSLAWARRFDRVPRGVTIPMPWLEFGKTVLPKERHYRRREQLLNEFAAAEKIEPAKIFDLTDYYELAARFLEWRARDAKAKQVLKASNAAKKTAKAEAKAARKLAEAEAAKKSQIRPLTGSRPRKK